MASMWQKVTVYLGLGPDDGFDEPEPMEERAPARPQSRPASSGRPTTGRATEGIGVVRTLPASAETSANQSRRPMVVAEDPQTMQRPRLQDRPSTRRTGELRLTEPRPGQKQVRDQSVVRPIRPAATPVTMTPSSFNDAQEMADHFLDRQPVIVNLQGAEQSLSRRLIDFASGLCYGMGGQMTKVANHVYLLTPPDMEVPTGDQLRMRRED